MKITTAQLRQIIKEEIEKELLKEQELNEVSFNKILGSIGLAAALLTGGAMTATNTAEKRAEIANSIGVETGDSVIVKAKKLEAEIGKLEKRIEDYKKSPGKTVVVGSGKKGGREVTSSKEKQDERIRQAQEALEKAKYDLEQLKLNSTQL
jgi:hypothetical protein